MMIFVGCYTDKDNPNGLKTLRLDAVTGELELVGEYSLSNALYQTLSSDGRFLYSCTGEGIASLSIEPDGKLHEIDSVPLGDCICHVAELPELGRVAFAEYLGGFAGSCAVKDGFFSNVKKHQHYGSGPNLPRQESAHCHQACKLPGAAGYAVCDLGSDEIVEYPRNRVFKTTPRGAGPRHLLFHPDGRQAFLVSELGNIVSSLAWTVEKGFTLMDSHSTLENDFSGLNLASAIRFTPDNKRVVVSNRGENSLAVFDFDENTEKLTFKSRTMLDGNWPRDFIFVTDSLALVALEKSGEIHSLKYDSKTGSFTLLHKCRGVFRPVALNSI